MAHFSLCILKPSVLITGLERKWFAILDVSQSSGFGKLENEKAIAVAQKCAAENVIVI